MAVVALVLVYATIAIGYMSGPNTPENVVAMKKTVQNCTLFLVGSCVCAATSALLAAFSRRSGLKRVKVAWILLLVWFALALSISPFVFGLE